MVPVSNGESIFTACAMVAQASAGVHFEFFLCPHIVHRMPTVIRTSRPLSTGLCTPRPQVTWRNSENTPSLARHALAAALPRARGQDRRRYDLTEIAHTPICPGPAA